MNDIEFGSVKLLKLKYRRGDQIIQLFCGIALPPIKLGAYSLIYEDFKSRRQVLLNHTESIEM